MHIIFAVVKEKVGQFPPVLASASDRVICHCSPPFGSWRENIVRRIQDGNFAFLHFSRPLSFSSSCYSLSAAPSMFSAGVKEGKNTLTLLTHI